MAKISIEAKNIKAMEKNKSRRYTWPFEFAFEFDQSQESGYRQPANEIIVTQRDIKSLQSEKSSQFVTNSRKVSEDRSSCISCQSPKRFISKAGPSPEEVIGCTTSNQDQGSSKNLRFYSRIPKGIDKSGYPDKFTFLRRKSQQEPLMKENSQTSRPYQESSVIKKFCPKHPDRYITVKQNVSPIIKSKFSSGFEAIEQKKHGSKKISVEDESSAPVSPARRSDSSVLTNYRIGENYSINSSNNITPNHSHNQSSGISVTVRSASKDEKHANNLTLYETEGKISSANGTATGALNLRVNVANCDFKKVITLWQNYYPEGGWGWVVLCCAFFVNVFSHGIQLSFSPLGFMIIQKFHVAEPALLGLLISLSIAVSCLLSPVIIAFCKTKSTRLSAVFGGLFTCLGSLFTSFASQYGQLYVSYGLFIGTGIAFSRDAATLMVGQYFKRKRETVEIAVVCGSGAGIVAMSTLITGAISQAGWRLGLQMITILLTSTFFMGTCYRSASLYHPQRRAILHLKNQRKKVKDTANLEKPLPFLDFTCLKSRTLQIIMFSCAFSAFGMVSPLYFLMVECADIQADEQSFTLMHVYVGLGWILGAMTFGIVAVQKSNECRVSKQYLCQIAGALCGLCVITLPHVKDVNGLSVFAWSYGFTLGGYNYALKTYTYERVRSRHFPRAWSFIQSSQGVPVLLSVPLIGYMNIYAGRKCGYYLAAVSMLLGSSILTLSDIRRRRLSKRKALNEPINVTAAEENNAEVSKTRRLSFAMPVEKILPSRRKEPENEQSTLGHLLGPNGTVIAKDLTFISEDAIGELNFQDIYFEDLVEIVGEDCITSCNKVENCLLSEYDADLAPLYEKMLRRRSLERSNIFSTRQGNDSAKIESQLEERKGESRRAGSLESETVLDR